MTALAGRCIVLTRPLEQSTALAQLIGRAGGEALLFPALMIEPVHDVALTQRVAELDAYHGVIFISPNAARHGVAAVRATREWPRGLKCYALGPGTARVLSDAGVHQVVIPAAHDSEGMLRLPALNTVAGQRWLIVRGVGGRELLADTLRERGAVVDYAECYRRIRPETDAAPLVRRWATGGVHAVVISSAETLHNLAAMLGEAGAGYLAATPWFVPHEKIAAAARRFGIQTVIVTAGGDDGALQGLVNWFQIKS
jgi:uroporphyrinogen-III synthase